MWQEGGVQEWGTTLNGCSYPLMPGIGTEQGGWVLGNSPLAYLNVQNQLEVRQRMEDRSLSLLGENTVSRWMGGQQLSMGQ